LEEFGAEDLPHDKEKKVKKRAAKPLSVAVQNKAYGWKAFRKGEDIIESLYKALGASLNKVVGCVTRDQIELIKSARAVKLEEGEGAKQGVVGEVTQERAAKKVKKEVVAEPAAAARPPLASLSANGAGSPQNHAGNGTGGRRGYEVEQRRDTRSRQGAVGGTPARAVKGASAAGGRASDCGGKHAVKKAAEAAPAAAPASPDDAVIVIEDNSPEVNSKP